MNLLPDNAAELVIMAEEIGAEVFEGRLVYPSVTGGWQLGNLDFDEYLARYRDQHVVVIIAPIGEAEPVTFKCDVCGYVMTHLSPCPRCARRAAAAAARTAGLAVEAREQRDILDQVEDLLDGGDGGDQE